MRIIVVKTRTYCETVHGFDARRWVKFD
jgi:hypothetical protein